ncbi:unnamed protein product [Brassica oleracea]|uniref:Bifunctional inhibitor/plant lipid transfer protein/seed storage helical domain-containing protein n=1 Tax=Brassica oleracea TaxID=3712 RepID=A0A3P6FGM8_BRAOL|nr:unnamed protein product [Brassica oleracea]
MAKDIVKPCLRGVPRQMPTLDCCVAIVDADRQAIGTPGRRDLCECYKAAIKSSPYNKIINFPQLCRIPLAVPMSPTIDCKMYIYFPPIFHSHVLIYLFT